MLWNSTGSLGSCAAAAQGRAGGTRPAVTPLCRAWRPPGWDSQGRARAVPPCPKPPLGRLALRDGILHHVIRWNVPIVTVCGTPPIQGVRIDRDLLNTHNGAGILIHTVCTPPEYPQRITGKPSR